MFRNMLTSLVLLANAVEKTIISFIQRLMLILWQLQLFDQHLNIVAKSVQHAQEPICPNRCGQVYVVY